MRGKISRLRQLLTGELNGGQSLQAALDAGDLHLLRLAAPYAPAAVGASQLSIVTRPNRYAAGIITFAAIIPQTG